MVYIPMVLCSPIIIRVPFFLLFGFNKGSQDEKRAKGYYILRNLDM